MEKFPTALLRFVMVGAVLLILVGGHAVHVSQGLSSIHDAQLDPTPYRALISHVEDGLFAAPPLSVAQRRDLAGSLSQLAQALEQRGGTRLARYRARDVQSLAARAENGWGPLGRPELEAMRLHWQSVRVSLFADEQYGRWAETDTVAMFPSGAPSATSASAVGALAAVADRLDGIAARGASEVELLGEPQDDPAWRAAHGPALIEAWSHWAAPWRVDLEAVRADLPRASADASSPFSEARSRIVAAIDELESVPQPRAGAGRTPTRNEWGAHFAAATRALDAARAALERARAAERHSPVAALGS